MVSHIISTFSGKPVFGYLGMVYAIASIGILGFIVWSFYSYSSLVEQDLMVALPHCEVGVINFAVCWNSLVLLGTFNSKNPTSYTQSAGNPYTTNSLTSSSETTREASFNFSQYYINTSNPNPPSTSWLEWFIGFSEGDGAILISGDRPRFVLTQKEGAILYHIKEVLGFGTVRHFGTYYRFIVEDKAGIVMLTHIFNGNLVLQHRVNQLSCWFAAMDVALTLHAPYIVSVVLPTLQDAWLSGFTDAEGCFNVNIMKRSNTVTGFRVILRFLLDQNNAQSVLQHTRDLIGFGSVAFRGETKGVYRLTIDSFKGLISVRDYFLAFPLKSKKAISFTNWNTAYSMVLKGEHLTDSGLDQIRAIKKTINVNNSLNTKTGSAHP